MKFKVLTAYSPEEVEDEIARFKFHCNSERIQSIKVTSGEGGWLIVISYQD